MKIISLAFMKKEVLVIFLCIYFVQLNAQIVTEKAEQRLNNTLPKTVLDYSIATIYYQFSQQVFTDNNKPIILTDTTVLQVGNIYSVYYNRSSALRDSTFSAKALSIPPQQVKEISVIRDDIQFEDIIRDISDGFFNEQQANKDATYIYKNRQTNTITSIDGDYNEMFLCEENIPPLQWNFLPDTLTVLNYLCNKAETVFRGRKYFAFFTVDIPLNDGPWKIYGLPGLILRLEDDMKLFLFEAIGITNSSRKPIEMNADSFTRCTNKQLQLWIENKRRNIARSVFSNGKMYISGIKNKLLFHRREIDD